MIISIASGKGGTGKTTIAVNLATALGKEVQVLDCDVEEPNAHLFLNPKMSDKETVYTPVPEVDMENAPTAKNAWKSAGSGPLPLSEKPC